MTAADSHPFRDLRDVLRDVLRAVVETFFYRRIILDPPPWPGWFEDAKVRIILPIRRKAKR